MHYSISAIRNSEHNNFHPDEYVHIFTELVLLQFDFHDYIYRRVEF